ncbi:hypothetical protein [Legionella geestiana]|uniref:hypothetical protein n=1 Tax=Legionella geestiana TaxID=45065 RepID=UPI001092F172|nr:hypothetical protein [Legionella geestiana]
MTPCLFLEQKRRDCLLINELLQVFCPVQSCLTAKKLLLELESPNAQLQQVLARASQIRATIEPGLCFFSRRITSDTLNRIIEDGLQPPAP